MISYNRGDDTLVCPYDTTHNVQKKSFQAHLIKCRENNIGKVSKVACKFDKTHIIPKPELKHHLSECPSRSVIDRDIQFYASEGKLNTGDVVGPQIVKCHSEETTEDWASAPSFQKRGMFAKNYPNDEFGAPNSATSIYKQKTSEIKQKNEDSSETTFRKMPLAPSKAAQMSGLQPMGSSSSKVYDYSVTQVRSKLPTPSSQTDKKALTPTGRGRGVSALKAESIIGVPEADSDIRRYSFEHPNSEPEKLHQSRQEIENVLSAKSGSSKLSKKEPEEVDANLAALNLQQKLLNDNFEKQNQEFLEKQRASLDNFLEKQKQQQELFLQQQAALLQEQQELLKKSFELTFLCSKKAEEPFQSPSSVNFTTKSHEKYQLSNSQTHKNTATTDFNSDVDSDQWEDCQDQLEISERRGKMTVKSQFKKKDSSDNKNNFISEAKLSRKEEIQQDINEISKYL
ncbi:uncharacterized protein LOC131927510 isoform X2 [Physella acuta]|uniref:uncharacterized protein LOC131927510 isoform X2 n=1 Tax=Physella acuta TaxID=109671 RepID=UPI0027DAF2AB|nr:uncharacterized protein LOC131927510 isoform X2 [Physella acuta]